MIVISDAREVITSFLSLLITNLALLSFTEPVFLAWMLFSAAAVDAAPPMWNVRIVSCVPGSPID